jgi:HK97 family phage portal protein
LSYLFGGRERRQLQFINPPIPPNSQGGGTIGGPVDLSDTESSLQKIAVWACVNLVATIAECMPLDTFTGVGEQRKPVPTPDWLENLDGSGQGLGDWLYQYVYSSMLRGNAYGIILDRDRSRGTPTQIALQHPDDVKLWRPSDGNAVEWRVKSKAIDPETMWHRRVHPIPGHVLGLSPIQMQAMTIGLGISALQFGSQWFRDGAHPSGILTNGEVELSKTQADTAKSRFLGAIRGTREPVVLGKGWDFKAIQIAPEESQFLQTNNFTGAECCRIFGPGFAEVFGYAERGTLTYTNIEQRSLDLLTYAADPWLVRLEKALSSLLPKPRYVKFNRSALVRTDLLTRYQAHEISLRNQWKTVNEVRDDEDMQPVKWGHEPIKTTPPPGQLPPGQSNPTTPPNGGNDGSK